MLPRPERRPGCESPRRAFERRGRRMLVPATYRIGGPSLTAVSATSTPAAMSAAATMESAAATAAMEPTGKAWRATAIPAAVEAIPAEAAIAIGTHPVTASPAAIVAAIDVPAVVAAEPVAAIASVRAARDRARRQGEHQGECRAPGDPGAHLASPASPSSAHCSSPNSAPRGSATSAIVPPWLSSCGATTTVPPSRVASDAAAAMSATRT